MEQLAILVVIGIAFAVVNAITEKINAAARAARIAEEQERQRRLAAEAGAPPPDYSRPFAATREADGPSLAPLGPEGPRRSGGVIAGPPAADDRLAEWAGPLRPAEPPRYDLAGDAPGEVRWNTTTEARWGGDAPRPAAPASSPSLDDAPVPRGPSAAEALRAAIEARLRGAGLEVVITPPRTGQEAPREAPPDWSADARPQWEIDAADEERREAAREVAREQARALALASWEDEAVDSGRSLRERVGSGARGGVVTGASREEARAEAQRQRLARLLAGTTRHHSLARSLLIAEVLLRPRWRE